MKFSSVLLALPLAASAAVIEERQNVRAGQPKESLKPVMRTGASRKFFTLPASYSLKANPNPNGAASGGGHSHGGGMGGMGGMMGEGDAQSFRATITGGQLCAPCTVLAGQIRLTYADGSPANVSNGVYIHHILTNGGRQEAFISGLMGMMPSGFVGAGDDNGGRPFVYTPKDGSFESGYWIQAADRFTAEIVLVNYNPAPKTVYINYDLEYFPGLKGTKVKSSLISATLGNPKTDRNRAVNSTGTPMSFKESGRIISAKGHLHDGGVAMYMELKKAGRTYFSCSSRATYGGVIHGTDDKTISDMSDCNTKPISVSRGDTMVMTAEYNLKLHPLRGTTGGGEGGTMGMFRIIWAPS